MWFLKCTSRHESACTIAVILPPEWLSIRNNMKCLQTLSKPHSWRRYREQEWTNNIVYGLNIISVGFQKRFRCAWSRSDPLQIISGDIHSSPVVSVDKAFPAAWRYRYAYYCSTLHDNMLRQYSIGVDESLWCHYMNEAEWVQDGVWLHGKGWLAVISEPPATERLPMFILPQVFPSTNYDPSKIRICLSPGLYVGLSVYMCVCLYVCVCM